MSDEDAFRPKRTLPPAPPPYEPVAPDPLEAAQIEMLELRGARPPGEPLPETP